VVARPPESDVREKRRKRSRRRKLWDRARWPLLAFGVLCVASIVDVAARYLPAALALQHGRDDVTQVQTLLTGDLAHLDQARITRAQALLADAQADFGSRSAVLSDGWIGGVAAHLPLLGPQVEAARALRAAGRDGTLAGSQIVTLVGQLVPAPGSTTPLFTRLVGVAQDHKADLTALSAQLGALQSDIAAIPDGALFGPLDKARSTLRTQGSKVLTSAGPAISLLEALPEAIGAGQHTYLLLFENTGEIRPGGGFIGAVGQMTFSDGALTSQVFRDSLFSDPATRGVQAPRAYRIYQNNIDWQLAETAWSPSFPQDVADAEMFYTKATGVHPDGAIAVDPIALAGVLSVLGPVTVPPYPQVITAANAEKELNYISNNARPGDPGKVFLPPFGQAVATELLHAGVGQAPALAGTLQTSAQQKHVLLYFASQHLESLVQGANFDGGVHAPLGDSVQVLDANLSGSKGDLFVTRHYSLAATVGSDGQVHDTLTLSYQNPVPTTPADQALVATAEGQYRDYIQVLVPETAQLDGMTVSVDGGKPSPVGPESISYDLHRLGVAYFLVVPRGGTATLTLTYEGPFADISRSPLAYSLAWQRQNVAHTWPIDVRLSLPQVPPRQYTSDLSVDRSWTVTGAR
jgi:hypothetical protein